jgi:hypothetical protein
VSKLKRFLWGDEQTSRGSRLIILLLSAGLFCQGIALSRVEGQLKAMAHNQALMADTMSNMVTIMEHLPMKTTLTDGSPVTPDHREINPVTGQQKGYVVLSAEERAKGYVEPVRSTYVHVCGAVTTMSQSLAETYARQPEFYSGTFCVGCRDHFPVGDDGEFVWDGTTQKVGTRR